MRPLIKNKFFLLDATLIVILAVALAVYYLGFISATASKAALFFISSAATIPIAIAAVRSLLKRKISVDLLASIALIASLTAGEWVSAAFINLMLVSARILDEYTENRARGAIEGLLKLKPQKVKIKRGEEIIEAPAGKIRLGDLVVIQLGERFPVDGTVVQGEASVDQSSLTGESVPVSKAVGDRVFSSTLVVSGELMVKAEKIGEDTTLEKIIKLVKESHKGKSEITNIADRFAGFYIVGILALAGFIYFFSKNFNLLLSVLLVACADDIAVAIPLGFLASINAAAKRGIIIKGGNFLEGLTKVKTMVLDKTGTVTKGRLKVEDIVSLNGYSRERVAELAVIAEIFSNHPAAKAIIEYAKKSGVPFKEPEDFKEHPGKGSIAIFGGKKIFAGKQSFFEEEGIEMPAGYLAEINKAKERGLNVTLIGDGDKVAGFVFLADEVRPEVKEAIRRIKSLGVERFVMLTGDNEKVAANVAEAIGVDEFRANLMPEEKVDFVKKNLGVGGKVAMVGDGVNDAAALAISDIGIAMGVIGSDAAIEAADIALMKDNFSKIAESIYLGQRTMRVAYQNFWIWGVVNAVGLVLVFGRIIGPNGAAAYNFLTDFFPLINAMRLFRPHKMLAKLSS